MNKPTYKELERRLKEAERVKSEYKNTEKKLRESEEKYRELTNSIGDIFFALDKNLKYTYRNRTADKFSSLKAGYAIGKSPTEVFPGEKTKNTMKVFKEVLKTQRKKNIVNEYYREGEKYYIDFNVYPSKSGISVFGKDITNKVLIENAIKESEEKYRNLVERANDGIAIVQEGVYKYVNPCLADIIGCPVEQLIGAPFIKRIHSSEIPKLTNRFKQRMASKRIPSIYETVIKLRNGREVHVEINASIITYQGAPADFAIIRDVTERKKIEKELRQSEEKYRAVAESAFTGICVADNQENIIYVNPAFTKMLGYTNKEIVGMNTSLIVDKEEFSKIKETTQKRWRGIKSIYETTLRCKNGDLINVLISGSPLKMSDGSVENTLAVIMDITDRKRVENKVLIMQRDLEKLIMLRTEELKRTNESLQIEIDKHKKTENALYQSEKELKIRNKISEIFLTIPDEEMYNNVLSVISLVHEK